MKFNKWVAIATVALASTAAQASTEVFFFNFDGTSSDSVLNTVPAGGWTVPVGTVDVVATGNQWGIRCAGNAGRCVDLDGSTNKPGLLSLSFDTVANMTYNLTFDLSGNQRSGGSAHDTVDVHFGSAFKTITVQKYADFSPYSLSFTSQNGGKATLSFLNDGNDNQGAILDNVLVTSVPEPETYALMLAGLGLMGTVVRRRQKRQA